MAELKTKKNKTSVSKFIKSIKNKQQQEDCLEVINMMKEITSQDPEMWGSSIVGFGSYHYRYASGREGDWPLTGFSPRAKSLTIYIMPGFDLYPELMSKLGKYKTGKSCLYLKQLKDIDKAVLKSLIKKSVQAMKNKYSSPA